MTFLEISGVRREIDLIHGELAALDTGRADLDLALAGEQRHGAHLAQVHADRVVGLVEGARRQVELELLPFRPPPFPPRGAVDRLDVRRAGISDRSR